MIALQNSRVFGPMNRIAAELYSRRAVDVGWQRVGLSPDILDGPPLFLPYRIQAEVMEAMARTLGERHLGAMVAARYSYEDLGIYAGYVLDAPRLDSAFARGIAALRTVLSHAKAGLRPSGDRLVLSYESGIRSVVGSRHIDEGLPLILTDLCRRFLGSGWYPEWVELPGARPPTAQTLSVLFGAPVHFGCDLPGIALRPKDLTRANLAPRPAREVVVAADLRELLCNQPPSTATGVVREAIEVQLRLGDTSLEKVAARLGLGPRSLQRRLAVEGAEFRTLRQSILSARARALVTETSRPLNEIAAALGYDEVNSFRRAFRSWFGASPSAVRMKGA
ncbi:AraC family transcriptional regulator ligand-binding domain-containing protein [Limibaculum sp. M0105]|uniref:AraC family transcriptional regulator ligand-binding domain-containing protein n=1 Tax=Thermohalobaculum xanthum TaxID=2753746 RepID=A0A8J7M588_9RHOB|nr:AraC family transcriptional regulator [Thermohalobaculum xanthum]MBK0398556.1 AraC family transcriptional regulator ligand-binding domain-containing protein [Thermohalobaculum xanthum]